MPRLIRMSSFLFILLFHAASSFAQCDTASVNANIQGVQACLSQNDVDCVRDLTSGSSIVSCPVFRANCTTMCHQREWWCRGNNCAEAALCASYCRPPEGSYYPPRRPTPPNPAPRPIPQPQPNYTDPCARYTPLGINACFGNAMCAWSVEGSGCYYKNANTCEYFTPFGIKACFQRQGCAWSVEASQCYLK